jgi:hypothetical protein
MTDAPDLASRWPVLSTNWPSKSTTALSETTMFWARIGPALRFGSVRGRTLFRESTMHVTDASKRSA